MEWKSRGKVGNQTVQSKSKGKVQCMCLYASPKTEAYIKAAGYLVLVIYCLQEIADIMDIMAVFSVLDIVF